MESVSYTHLILTSVMQFAMLPLQGIAQGAQPISSYNYGAKNADRVKKTFRLLLITCLSYSVLLWAAVQLVPRVFVSIFTADTDLIGFTAPMLKIYLGDVYKRQPLECLKILRFQFCMLTAVKYPVSYTHLCTLRSSGNFRYLS